MILDAIRPYLAQAKLILFGILLLVVVSSIAYGRLQGARADAAEIEAGQYKAAMLEAQTQAQEAIDRAAATDAILLDREQERVATQKKLDSAQRKYKQITQERGNDPESCVNRPLDGDIADWLHESAHQD
jgi:type II secretory pathway pseudopilin PulG